MKRKILCLLLVVLMVGELTISAGATGLSKRQQRIADTIAEIAIERYEETKILPSVAVGQALTESSLGLFCIKPNNLWGLKNWNSDTYAGFDSLESGLNRYFEILSKSRYKSARQTKDYYTQLSRIIASGYDDSDSYVSDTVRGIERFGFYRYDKELFERLEAKKEKLRKIRQVKRMKRKQGHLFTVVYDLSVPSNEAWVSKSISNGGGSVQIMKDDEYYNIFDLRTSDKVKGYEIHVSDDRYAGWKVYLEFNENAKG